ncbi:hypothetical protein ASPZODRAFT_137982 [Penicilliopsis zonata CBS 506.65]|uniref:Galactosyl transferase GMA12/MNN10 family protein n=1 Tax=Penicilliopsis zonata CBS 506.65 TaxID=1073090 RepID=A0A1L9SUH8_9EURO|nr:hypothetical protein ASPZODRAFT_137982 [Penicilliopsis zonata CBS 506.65]OJJ50849.1 hypothetical protein ASPZODRAFT_137982 [Penicilliopsis zonata CBS 506.65]
MTYLYPSHGYLAGGQRQRHFLRLGVLACIVTGLFFIVYRSHANGGRFEFDIDRWSPRTGPSVQIEARRPSIAKATIVYGDSPVYEEALRTHREHSRRFQYPMHVLRQGILSDVWTKPAFLLSLVLQELMKPEGERLEWILWFDADTIVMNPNIPIELFLPPTEDFEHIHLVLSKDWNGVNNGVFPIKVHPWSVELLSSIIAYPYDNPDTLLVFRDQSALGFLLDNEYFANSTAYVPLRWFNAYRGKPDGGMSEIHPEELQIHRGDFLVHFAGTMGAERNDTMTEFTNVARHHLPSWEVALEETNYPAEVREYWARMRQHLHSQSSEFE